MRKFGIHVRLLVAVFMLIGATTFSLGYIGAKFTYGFIQTRFEERMLFLARYLALNSELGILIDERSMLKRLARNLLAEKDVVRVAIFNSIEEVLADESKSSDGILSVVEVPVVMREAREDGADFRWGIYQEPFEEMVGKVRITYSTEGVNKLLTDMKIRYIWIALGVSGISALVFYFISRSLVFPVTQLAHAARKIEKGDVELRARPGSLPETRELVLAFNAMLDSLERNRMALEKANQEVVRQKTLAELGKFSLMVAHEVKNPLGIIKSSLDILRKELADPSGNTMANFIDDEVKRLNRLIEEFLLFARPASPHFREMDANQMLKDCIERFEIQYLGSDLSIERQIGDEQLLVQGDPDLLSRAVGNVIKNAIEANDGKGQVLVRSWRDPVFWRLEIQDEGPGVSDEHMDKLFDPFFTTRSKGTGLGLAFVAQVVGAHGGAVSAANRIERAGAVFNISIPRADSGVA